MGDAIRLTNIPITPKLYLENRNQFIREMSQHLIDFGHPVNFPQTQQIVSVVL